MALWLALYLVWPLATLACRSLLEIVMTSLCSLAYISNASRSLSDHDIDFLLADSRAYNEQHGISGVLLYDKGIFFQLLEAEPEALAAVYQRIKNANRHRNITEFFYRPVNERLFAQWFMGFSHVPTTVLQQLAQSNWLTEIHSNPDVVTPSEGMLLLLDFWQVATQSKNR